VSAPFSDDLLRDIEEKAKACPTGQDDGPWEVLAFERKWQTGERGVQHRVVCDTKAGWDHPFPILEVDPDGYCTEESTRALADYLRSLAPPVVLALLERLKKAEAVKTAWDEQSAHVEHAVRCETSRQHYGARAEGWPDLNDPRCNCGLRELVLALEAL
jgi:hypothetical protein